MKPWKKFRDALTVFAIAKNTYPKGVFSFVTFLWTSKEK